MKIWHAKHANPMEQADCRFSFGRKWRWSNWKMEHDGTDQTCQCAITGWPRIFPPYQFVAHKELAATTAIGAGQDILLHTFFRVKVQIKWPGMSSSHPSFAVLCAAAL